MVKHKFSLKTKIILIVWGVIFCALLLPGIYFINLLKQEIRTDVIFNVKKELTLVKMLLSKDNISKDNLDYVIKDIGKRINDRITFIREDGIVIADSKVPHNKIKYMDNHATRPEIISARHNGYGSRIRYSRTLQKKLIYYAEKLNINSNLKGFLRIARPYSAIDATLNNMSRQVFIILLFSFIGSGIIIIFFVYSITKKISPIVDMAVDIGRGEDVQLIQDSPGKEFEPLIHAINKMSINIRENMRLISQQKDELKAILDGIDSMVIAINKERKIIRHNKSFYLNFRSHGKLLNRDITTIIINMEFIKRLKNALDKNKETMGLIISLRGRFYNINIIPLKNIYEIEAIIIIHDITEQKKLEIMRRDFVANISHELKTPITSIVGYTETLLDNLDLSEEQKKNFLEKIYKNSKEMIILIQDILNLSRIESKKIEVKIEQIDVNEIIDEIIEDMSSIIEEKEITIKKLDLPFSLYYDREKLYTVLKNLIHNSLKFSPYRGCIEILIKQDDEFYLIGVKDNGPGISEQEQSRIFERFYQSGYKDRTNRRGTGLGLSICKHIVTYFGGEIWVESPVKGDISGTIIWFSIPKQNRVPL